MHVTWRGSPNRRSPKHAFTDARVMPRVSNHLSRVSNQREFPCILSRNGKMKAFRGRARCVYSLRPRRLHFLLFLLSTVIKWVDRFRTGTIGDVREGQQSRPPYLQSPHVWQEPPQL